MRLALKIAGGIVALLLILAAALAIYIYLTALKPKRPVGFQQFAAADAGHPPIPVAVWYPADVKPAFVLLGSRGMRLAPDASVAGAALPLIIISHGTGGSALGHADTAMALAEQGFVVAAPTHPGDNLNDGSAVGRPEWLPDRTRQVSRTIDAVLGTWRGRRHVDPRRIGVFGFSAGATTALIAIGGRPDLTRIASQCSGHPEFVCRLTKPESYRTLKPVEWRADPRIRAAVIAAPGLGFTFEPNGLSDVQRPVQLWAGAADQTVPFATNAGLVRALLPSTPEIHVVPGARHYSFLMPCGLIGPPEFCRDPNGFDRSAFHRKFNASVVRFFKANLATPDVPR